MYYIQTLHFAQALRDLDFEVRDRLFLEKVMNVEFQDASITDKAIFYTGAAKWNE